MGLGGPFSQTQMFQRWSNPDRALEKRQGYFQAGGLSRGAGSPHRLNLKVLATSPGDLA